ncbi:AAA family ATPase [Azospirillum agricola]|uniref:AAA family ATPase n=1 Tax=Azospirillum agricola TaxID=1720247 RepID=UPI000A0F03C0|nr:AAA family ATPase [Azospirillum agricola]SMH38504.1 exonuclease SbcC [Azospirillum lipoferum]
MRILAVRGCNLTSLDGPFAVEFDREPLRRAGLFAITGPTGAGKSTILDALCLALFDRMPRLPDGQGVLLGLEGDPNAIRSTDARAVLRRGAGSGWAEVDFVGIDGKPYRARWEVRRARQKARGALQPQTMSLAGLDGGERLGDGKKSVLEEIERRLGLSFEQFRRAVLLAQGDFATFLKAPPRDRSALLELLTGTAIYSQLSVAAHERAVRERQALDALEAQGGGIGVLGAEERAALEAEILAADTAVREGERALERARAAVAWHEQDARLAAAEAQAVEARDAAGRAFDGAAPRREAAASLRRLQPLRPLLADADRAAAEAREAESLASRARTLLAGARTAVEDGTNRHADARLRFERVCREQQEAEPDLARAADLDGRITELAGELDAADRERAAAAGRAAASRERLRDTERGLDAARDETARLEGWLKERAAFEPVVAQWGRWESLLARHAEAVRTHRTAAGDSRRHAADSDRLAAEAARAEAERAAARDRLARADDGLARVQAEPAPSLEETRRKRTEATERRDRLTALAALADGATRLTAALAGADAERSRLTAEAEREASAARDAEAVLRLRQAALDEAEEALQRLRLAQREDVESLRTRLVAGEPCPVCGSAAHPWGPADRAPLLRVVHDQEHRVAALKAETAALLAAHAAHAAGERAARAALEPLDARRDTDRREAEALAGRWAGLAGNFDLPALPDAEAVRVRLADVETRLAAAAADEALALDHRRRLDAAQAGRRACDEEVVRHSRTLDALLPRLGEARHAEAMARALRDRKAEERDAALAELAEPFSGEAGWREALEAGLDGSGEDAGGRFRADIAARVAAFQNQRDRLARARQSLDAAVTERASRGADQEAARRAADEAFQRADGLNRRLADLRAERSGLLDGRTVAALRQDLADRRQEASARLEQATMARQEALTRLSAAERDAETRGETARACGDRAAAAAAALDRAAETCAVTVEEARERLATPEAALAAEEKALAELETARREAALLAAERTRRRGDHHAAGHPGREADAAAADAARIGEALAADRLRAGSARGRREADEGNRARLAGLTAAIEEQRARHGLWARMGQLIGSANGQKMRNFAQSLSLDMLLGHANRHLEDLARRYRLERVAGADLEIQVVDREMGDERRGVHSLSGGELFLVSLALALGLSAMAAGTAGSIGTLFIDEGFGTLDPDSLDVALSCLEALQAAGRQVGVISHVPALVERIGVQIRVVPLGGGRSRVTIRSAALTLDTADGAAERLEGAEA